MMILCESSEWVNETIGFAYSVLVAKILLHAQGLGFMMKTIKNGNKI